MESDNDSIDNQYRFLLDLKLPIVTLVHSGRRSLHAICRIDAKDELEFRKRFDFLADKCKEKGFLIDRNNKDINRLSRLPGVDREDQKQYLIGTYYGMSSWEEWEEYISQESRKTVPLLNLSDVEEKSIEWLIPSYIPKGTITIIAGSGGVGKSSVWCGLASAVSRGEPCMLEGTYPRQLERNNLTVIYYSAEDSTSRVLKARFRKYGANMENIKTIDMDDPLFPSIKFNSDIVEGIIDQYRPALCVFDLVQNFVSGKIKMSDRNAMRQELNRLLAIGERYGTSFLVIMHTNKLSGVWGRQRMADSADLWDIARSVLMVGNVPNEPGHIYVSQEKSNYGPRGTTVILNRTNDGVLSFWSYDERDDRDFVLEDSKGVNTKKQKDDADKLTTAMNIILSQLRDENGNPCEKPVYEINAVLKENNFTQRTIERAKQNLEDSKKIRRKPMGKGQQWVIIPLSDAEVMET